MTITEVQGDLFEAPQGYYLAHCISGDYTLGAGVAKEMDAIFNMRYKLNKQYDSDSAFMYVGSCLQIDNVFNLVTKPKYHHRVRIEHLKMALEDMRDYCVDFDITKIAMPKIGCGKDRLNWNTVKSLVEEIFEDTEVEFVVYSL